MRRLWVQARMLILMLMLILEHPTVTRTPRDRGVHPSGFRVAANVVLSAVEILCLEANAELTNGLASAKPSAVSMLGGDRWGSRSAVRPCVPIGAILLVMVLKVEDVVVVVAAYPPGTGADRFPLDLVAGANKKTSWEKLG
jgi:hypothetical protein